MVRVPPRSYVLCLALLWGALGCSWALDFDSASQCAPGFDDCNGDPSDGCESKLNEDRENCGGCGVSCPGQDGALSACEAGKCVHYAFSVGEAHGLDEHPVRGEHPGSPFGKQVCDEAVLTGINPAGSDADLRGLAVACAAVRFADSADPASVTVGRERPISVTVGNDGHPDALDRELRCEPGAALTAAHYVYGAVEIRENGKPKVYAGITRMSLTCSRIAVDAARQLQFDATGLASVDFPSQGWPMSADYIDECPAGEVIVGFDGFGSAVLDALVTECAPLTLERSTER